MEALLTGRMTDSKQVKEESAEITIFEYEHKGKKIKNKVFVPDMNDLRGIKNGDLVDVICFISSNEKGFTNIICKRIYKVKD